MLHGGVDGEGTVKEKGMVALVYAVVVGEEAVEEETGNAFACDDEEDDNDGEDGDDGADGAEDKTVNEGAEEGPLTFIFISAALMASMTAETVAFRKGVMRRPSWMGVD